MHVLPSSVLTVLVALSRNVAVAQSYVTVSGQWFAYQNVSVEVPVAGTVNVCTTELSPLVGVVEPSIAPQLPECAAPAVTDAAPDAVHPVRFPDSNPPFTIPPGGGATLTVNEIVAVCVVVPPVPVTVTAYVPAAVAAPAVSVSVELPDPGAAIVLGLKLAVAPPGSPDTVSEIALLNPPDTAVVTVLVPELPCTTDTVLGDAEIVKSGVALVVVITTSS